MAGWQHEAFERVERYAISRGLKLGEPLGQGFDGVVVSTDAGTAVKGLAFEKLYRKERDVYLRLMERQITDVNGFAVPALLWADDARWVVEMDIVSPPFVLDFASAYLDEQPEYPADVMQRWVDEKVEQFGADRWRIVQSVMATFGGMGIYLADVKPGNISFED